MKRREILKAGIVFAAASPAVALAPDVAPVDQYAAEDARLEVRRLSLRISELLDGIQDYERIVITARSVGPWAIYTEFTV